MSTFCIQCRCQLGEDHLVLCAATEQRYACLCGECAKRFPTREAAFEELEKALGVSATPEERSRLAMQDVCALAAAS
jgi:hypothetical protein